MATTMTASPPLVQTTIGKKILMAGSGIVILLWVFAHMAGNLKIFLSADEYDSYAAFLRNMLSPPLPHTWALWIVRIVLTVALVVHVYFAIVLARRSRHARVTRYAKTGHVQSKLNTPALTMRWGGLTLGLFIIFHLANFTWGWIHPGYTYVRSDPYGNVVGTFNNWWMVIIYLVAMVALAMHVYHGTWSVFQTIGYNSRRWDTTIRRGASTLAVVIFLGFMSVPFGVVFGAISR